jgi:hypothetical protein
VQIVLKSGSLGLLELSGPVQACNGIAVPSYLEVPSATAVRERYRSLFLQGLELTVLSVVGMLNQMVYTFTNCQ